MIETAHGIILRTRLLTETSLIVHWLAADRGRVATVAKGARRHLSPFAGKLDLFYEADFSFSRSRRSELHVLREVSVCERHATIREDVGRLQQAGYAVGIIEQATETETPLPEIFELTRSFLRHLCGPPPQARNVYALELKFLRELGLEPELAESGLAPGTRRIIEVLRDGDWDSAGRLRLTGGQIAEIRQYLERFMTFHLGRLPRGRSAALAEAG
jgi:DNA repair protein RecO (recombination protein O)